MPDAAMLAPWVKPLPAVGAPPLVTPHAALHVTGPRDAAPAGAELTLHLPSLALVAYVPTPEPPPAPAAPATAAPVEIAPDPFLRGNVFRVAHDSARTHAATIGIAAARRMESGPESERLFVVLRGNGLVFLQNEDTMRYAPLDAIFVPEGEPVRVWAQGPDDALMVVFQPRRDANAGPGAAAAARRTLASEVRRLKGQAPAANDSSLPR